MQIKKILCLLLCLTMLVSMLAGCGGQETPDPGSSTPPVSDSPIEETDAPTVDYEAIVAALNVDESIKPELVRASQAGFPMSLAEQATISGSELVELLDIFLASEAPDKLSEWKELYPALRSDTQPLTRFNAMAAIFLATRLAGEGYANVNFLPSKAQTLTHNWDEDYLNWELYGGFDALPTFDVGTGESGYLDGAAYSYFLGRLSYETNEYPFAINEESNSLRVKDNCTYAEALLAIVRVMDSEYVPSDMKYELTAIQSQEARYVPIAEVGTYNKDIVTDELVANVNLPEAGNGKAPVWNGYILENKIWVNFENEAWQKYTPGERYYNKFEIDHIAELGFNCVRIVYGLSYLSNPEDVYSINVSELEQLDELLSWCLENDLHLMISITGMPGKWNTSRQEEDVNKNPEIFTNPETAKAYAAYMEMLAMRYADIPSKALSFELLAEPGVPNDDVDLYAEVLEPVALAMWEHDSSKILIANDVYKNVPERMAEIGCVLSLHHHSTVIYSAQLMEWYGIDMSETYWPAPVVPMNMYDGQTVSMSSEEGFSGATISVAYNYFNYEPELYADGVLIPWDNATGRYAVYDAGELHVQIPDGSKELTIAIKDEMGVELIDISWDSKSAKILPLYIDGQRIDFEPEFVITSDRQAVCANEGTIQFGGWQHMYDTTISKFVECAEKHGVSYIMTEVGSDTQTLSVEDYIAYHTELLEILDEHNIGWMYNCIHNILAPPDIMWQGQAQGFTVTPIEGTPYFENREITDMLVSFAQQRQ